MLTTESPSTQDMITAGHLNTPVRKIIPVGVSTTSEHALLRQMHHPSAVHGAHSLTFAGDLH